MSDVSDPLPLTDPIPEAITIVLDPALDNQPWRLARRRLTTALRVALGQTGYRLARAARALYRGDRLRSAAA